MKSCRWGQVAIAAVLLTMLASPVHADALADARKAVAGSDYLTAQPALEEALKAGTSGPEDLAEIYRLTGIVQGALGNENAAEKAFGKWLALEPRGSLPAGTSPKITRPFEAAAATAKKKGPLAAKAETTDDPPTVTLVVASDPMKMIVGAKVYFSTDKKPEEMLRADGNKRVTIDLGTGKRIDLRLHAVDEYGNRVVELGSKDVPIVITSTGKEKRIDPKDRDLLRTRETTPDQPRPLVLQWWLWGGATIVAAGVGGYFAWRTKIDVDRLEYLNANSLSHTWEEAQDVESSARTNLLVTNIAAGAAGAFAIGTAILFFTRPAQDEGSERELRATVTPTRGGGAFVVGGHF
jgi:hypothetical protein